MGVVHGKTLASHAERKRDGPDEQENDPAGRYIETYFLGALAVEAAGVLTYCRRKILLFVEIFNIRKVVIILADQVQRTPLDVATELTQLYYSQSPIEPVKDIQETFLMFYAVAITASQLNPADLTPYMPENLKEIVDSFKKK